MENEKMSTDTKLRLENMYVTEWQLKPDGSESITMENKKVDNLTQPKTEPEIKQSNSISVKIYMAGDYDQARKILNDYCFTHGCCVNLVRNTYIYSAGEETGFIVELINYPRFEKTVAQLETIAIEIANILRTNLNQDSFTIQCLKDDFSPSKFYSWRHLRSK